MHAVACKRPRGARIRADHPPVASQAARVTLLMGKKKNRPKFYAVACGRVPGVYATWSECEPHVKGFKGAKFRSFPTSAEAQNFIDHADGGGAAAARCRPQQATAAAQSSAAAAQLTHQIDGNGADSGGNGSIARQRRSSSAEGGAAASGSLRTRAAGHSDMVLQASEFASKWVKATSESTRALTSRGVDRPGLRPPLRCAVCAVPKPPAACRSADRLRFTTMC